MFPTRLCLRIGQRTQHRGDHREDNAHHDGRVHAERHESENEEHCGHNCRGNRHHRSFARIGVGQHRDELILRSLRRISAVAGSGRNGRLERLRRLILGVEYGGLLRRRLNRTLDHQLITEVLVEFRHRLLCFIASIDRCRHRHLA